MGFVIQLSVVTFWVWWVFPPKWLCYLSESSYNLKKDLYFTAFFGKPLFKTLKESWVICGEFMGNSWGIPHSLRAHAWKRQMIEAVLAFLLTAWQVWQTLLSGQTGAPLTRILLKSSHKTRRMPAAPTPRRRLAAAAMKSNALALKQSQNGNNFFQNSHLSCLVSQWQTFDKKVCKVHIFWEGYKI